MSFLTTGQVADQLGLHRSGVNALIVRGSLRAERIGRDWLITPEDLNAFIAGRMERLGKVKVHQGNPRSSSPGRPPRKKAA